MQLPLSIGNELVT